MDIRKTLLSIGLTEGEAQVYEALLELGQTSTGAITSKAKIASSKVYEVLDRLQQKGLASFVLKNGVRQYDATPPERLIDYLEEKKDDISSSQNEILAIIPQMKLIRNKTEQCQTVVYTGNEGPKIVLNEILEAGKRGIDNCGYGTDGDPYEELMPAVLHRYLKEASKYKYRTRLIFAKGFKSPNKGANIRYIEKAYLPPVRTHIYGSKVGIVIFQKTYTTIIIDSKEVAASYLAHFEMLWKMA